MRGRIFFSLRSYFQATSERQTQARGKPGMTDCFYFSASLCVKTAPKILMNLKMNLTGGKGKNMSDRALKSDGSVNTVWGPWAEGALAPPTSCPRAYSYTLSKPLIYFLEEYRSGLNIKFSPVQQITIRTILNKAAVAHSKKKNFFFCCLFIAAGWG